MNHTELIKRVNRIADRYGFAKINRRKLRRWTEAKNALLIGPVTKGRRRGQSPDRQWAREHVRKLAIISCLMSRGVKRFAAIRAHLWLISGDPLTNLIRPSLISEYRRFRKRTFRKLATDTGPALNKTKNERRQVTLARQLGLPDIDPLARDQIISMVDAMRHGAVPVSADIPESLPIEAMPIPIALHNLATELVSNFQCPAWLKPTLDGLFEMFRQMVIGLAGEPDEIPTWAAEQVLGRASGKAVIAARQMTQVVPWIVRNACDFVAAFDPNNGASAVALKPLCDRFLAEFGTPRGNLLCYVQILLWIVRQKNNGIVIARDSYEVVPLFRKIIKQAIADREIHARLKTDNPISVILLLIKPESEMSRTEVDLRNWLRQRLRDHGVADWDRWQRDRARRG